MFFFLIHKDIFLPHKKIPIGIKKYFVYIMIMNITYYTKNVLSKFTVKLDL